MSGVQQRDKCSPLYYERQSRDVFSSCMVIVFVAGEPAMLVRG